MMAALAEIIPGAEGWPRFRHNRSRQFEARLSLVEVLPSKSVLLQGMAGSRLLIATSHGEDRAEFARAGDLAAHTAAGRLALRYVDNHGRPAARYPANPNGSPDGLAGLCSADGRVTVLMPHPERVHRTFQHSGTPPTGATTAPGYASSRTPALSSAEFRLKGDGGARSLRADVAEITCRQARCGFSAGGCVRQAAGAKRSRTKRGSTGMCAASVPPALNPAPGRTTGTLKEIL